MKPYHHKESLMKRAIVITVLTSVSGIAVTKAAQQATAQPPAGQYPVAEAIAKKLIQKYQACSCEQLAAERQQPPNQKQAETQQKAVQHLRQDPAMRKAFLNMVAGPIANKMFECGFIP